MARIFTHDELKAERTRVELKRIAREGCVDNRTPAERRADSLMLWWITPAAAVFTLVAVAILKGGAL